MRLPVALALLLLAGLACGGGDKVPKPWVEREGQTQVVGSQSAEGEPLREPLVQEAQRREVGPEGGPSGIPVEEDYSAMHDAGDLSCPAGTDPAGEKAPGGTRFCTLPDGRRHGPFMSWHGNGEVKEVGTYVDGMRAGLVTTWTPDGRKQSEMRWENGSPVGGQYFE